MESAADAIRKRGQVRDQFPEDYTPGIPGRQLNIFQPDGRQHRASVYMHDHRLIITETFAEPSDFAALQFEQSILMLVLLAGLNNSQMSRVITAKHSSGCQNPTDLARRRRRQVARCAAWPTV